MLGAGTVSTEALAPRRLVIFNSRSLDSRRNMDWEHSAYTIIINIYNATFLSHYLHLVNLPISPTCVARDFNIYMEQFARLNIRVAPLRTVALPHSFSRMIQLTLKCKSESLLAFYVANCGARVLIVVIQEILDTLIAKTSSWRSRDILAHERSTIVLFS